MISLKIKMPTRQIDVQVEDDCQVTQLRQAVATELKKETSQLVLIFGGKILKDEDTLGTHSIKDGHSVHLVVKNKKEEEKPAASTPAATTSTAPTTAPSAPQTTPTSTASSNPFAALGGMGGLGGMGAMNPQEMMNNPELMNQMMENPLVRQMMDRVLDNPQMLQEMMRSNPMMNQIIEQNPDLAHVFNNPAIIRQAIEMQRNPSMMQEMMRHQDRAMSNIENLPGGMQALERMYRDIQEPMMNATARPNQYQSGNNENASSTSNQAGRQNNEALPNPWGGGNQQSSNQTANQSTNNQSNSGSGNTAGLGSLFGGNINSEMMEQSMQMMRNNPELMRSMLRTVNPQMANNPQMEQMLTNYMTNPEMTNPAVIRALQQIQEGYETLRREAPRLFESFGAGMGSDMQQMMQQMGSTGLSGGLGGGAATPTANVTPAPDAETRFASQLEQLEMMGFNNRQANIEELTRTGGNVEAAVDRLLTRPR